MSDVRRRRSKMLRLMLAAVALLGIGAAITAAAWEDRVYFEVEARGATFDIQGRIADGNGDWLPGDFEDGWSQSDDPDAITLSVSFEDLIPGDTRDFYIQLRNEGSVTAYLNDADGAWTGSAECFGAGAANVDGDEDADPTSLLTIAGGLSSDVYLGTLTVPADWSNACQGAVGTFVFYFQYTTDAP